MFSKSNKMANQRYQDNGFQDAEQLPIRSEEVHDILSEMPHWIIRWGSLGIFILILSTLFLTYFLKYPVIYSLPVVITPNNTKEYLMFNKSGAIDRIFYRNNDSVKLNTPIAVLLSDANYKDVFLLKSILDTINIINSKFPFEYFNYSEFGAMNGVFAEFKNNYLAFHHSIKESKINSDQFKRNSNTKLKFKTFQSFLLLGDFVKKWHQENVIFSSREGKLSFNSHWKEGQLAKLGDSAFIITPPNIKYIGKININKHDASKLKLNQDVIIKPDSNHLSGIQIAGKIKYIEMLKGIDATLYIEITNSLKNRNDLLLQFHTKIYGKAEIVVNQQSFIEKIIL